MQLNPKIISTLSYLSTLLDPEQEVIFSIKGDKVKYAKSDNLIIKDVRIPSYSALDSVLSNLMNEMCTDCLKADYNFKNPFFIDLCKAYIQSLIHTYGDEVPITRTLATRIIEHKLYNGLVWAKQGSVNTPILSVNSDYLKDKPGQQWQYFLLANPV